MTRTADTSPPHGAAPAAPRDAHAHAPSGAPSSRPAEPPPGAGAEPPPGADTPVFADPPWPSNAQGQPRRVGVELEFATLPPPDAAAIVQGEFGGRLEPQNDNRVRVVDTALGDFLIELDARVARYPTAGDAEPDDHGQQAWLTLREGVQDALSDVATLGYPYEVVCPPVAYPRLAALERLFAALRRAGAEGTQAGPFLSCSLQLNPEIPDGPDDRVVALVKAFLLLADTLREEIDMDRMRRIAGYADPFPADYVARVVRPDYWPDRAGFIDDYLADNPTRNRPLDLLPLFAHWDKGRLERVVCDHKVKPRPTLHYRLPDTGLDRADWTLAEEWDRWVKVERLAADPARLADAGRQWLAARDRGDTGWVGTLRRRLGAG